MKAVRLALAFLGGAVLLFVVSVAAAATAIHTSIRRADCAPPPPEIVAEFREGDLGVQQCPAPDGWRLLFVASHANSWLELRRDDFRWSSEEAVVYDRPIGLFPNVGGSPVVEWRRNARGTVDALIFRVTAQDPGNPVKHVSRLFVVRLGGGPCVIGRVITNEAARRLADGPTTCGASKER